MYNTEKDKTIDDKPIDNKPVIKKRGRKKKWETTPFKNNYVDDEPANKIIKPVYNDTPDTGEYNTNNLKFGNLFIKVQDKESQQTPITNFFISEKNKTDCYLNISSDEDDTCNFKGSNSKRVTLYNKNGKVDIKMDIKCYNCHYNFENKPFYLPIDYCIKLNRYKLFGNFCSPNCVKSYSLNNIVFQTKTYLIGQYYRKLFGYDFKITPAPNILTLIDYGGTLTIEEFRKSLYYNSRYIISNVNTKIVFI